jgi:hypothetical protein
LDPDSYLSVFSSAIEITAPSGGAILAIVLAGLFLCVSAFVSASEIAYFSLTSEELQEFDEESPRDRLVKRLLARTPFSYDTYIKQLSQCSSRYPL